MLIHSIHTHLKTYLHMKLYKCVNKGNPIVELLVLSVEELNSNSCSVLASIFNLNCSSVKGGIIVTSCKAHIGRINETITIKHIVQ